MNLSDALKEAVETPSTMQEASLSRIWQHHKKGAFVILTSWRGPEHKPKSMTAQEWLDLNRKVLAQLKQQIRGAGYGFIPAEGVGQEKTAAGEQYEAKEPVLIVPNPAGPDPDRSFLRQALKWGKAPGGHADFRQDYVFYHTVDESGQALSAIVNPAQSADQVKFKKFKPGDISDYYTRIRGGRSFAYEWVGLKYGDPPANQLGKHGKRLTGEIDFHLRETMDGWLAAMGRG